MTHDGLFDGQQNAAAEFTKPTSGSGRTSGEKWSCAAYPRHLHVFPAETSQGSTAPIRAEHDASDLSHEKPRPYPAFHPRPDFHVPVKHVAKQATPAD